MKSSTFRSMELVLENASGNQEHTHFCKFANVGRSWDPFQIVH